MRASRALSGVLLRSRAVAVCAAPYWIPLTPSAGSDINITVVAPSLAPRQFTIASFLFFSGGF